MEPAIVLNNVSKRFAIDHRRPRSFLEAMTQVLNRGRRASREYFWVLRDVSLNIEQGEIVGIVGSNGAGKSSLLKLIAHIIEPTSGEIVVSGKLGALLELGIGFHPDLTGRENIYLYGALVGLKRQYIRDRVDDIIAFSGLGPFIDVPVKHYSSGMYVRLAFSVAVSAEPDILLVDEVLAVGDQRFQAKCWDKIEELRGKGITILFVSHTLDTVRRLCQRAIWLDDGCIQADGEVNDVLNAYLESVWSHGKPPRQVATAVGRRWGSGEAIVERVEFLGTDGSSRSVFHTGEPFVARIWYRAFEPVPRPAFGVAIYREDGVHVAGPNTAASQFDIPCITGQGYVDYIVDSLPLLPARYEFTAAIYDYHSVHPYDHRHRQFEFQVVPSATTTQHEGTVLIPCRWAHEHT